MDNETIANKLDKIIELLEGIANEFAYYQQWRREQAQYPQQVQVVERNR